MAPARQFTSSNSENFVMTLIRTVQRCAGSLALLALSACNRDALVPGPVAQPGTVAMGRLVTAIHATHRPPPALAERISTNALADLSPSDQFYGFSRYPAEERDWLAMENATAYTRDWFISGDTEIQATADGETWSASASLPDGSQAEWQTITFRKQYNGQQDCFVTSSWSLCGSTSAFIAWYVQSQCQPSGTWTMKFYHNGQEWHQGQFTLLPRIPPSKVPVMNQLQYTSDNYANWCHGPGASNKHVCDGRAGEVHYTIKQKGCALTSSAMVLGYHGVQVDPPTLNRWLIAHGGYSAGSIVFPKIAEYARTVGGVDVHYLGSFAGRNDAATEQAVCQNGPQVIPVYGSDGRPTGHFVAATGRDDQKTTFLINDPAGGLARTLASFARYRNTYAGRRVFRGPERQYNDPLSGLAFYLHSPAEVLVTDGQGRRTGFDPASGTTYAEITGAVYDSTSVIDPDDSTDEPDEAKEWEMMGAPAGEYTVTITGTGTGTYMLDMRAWDNTGADGASVFDSIPIAPGVVHTYRFAYDPAQPAGPMPVTGGFMGSGQKATVDAFLSYSAPTERSIALPAGTTTYPLMVFFGRATNPASFTAVLNGTSIASMFRPSPGGVNTIRLPLRSGRNVLQLSVRGSNGSRMPRDVDRLVFLLP
jgi:hypothetical protein